MAHVLVACATAPGSAREIADHVVERLKAAGHVVSLVDARTATRTELGWFDAAILAGAFNAGQNRAALSDFVRSHRYELERVPTAFIAVIPLSAAGVGWRHAGADADLAQFFAGLGWSAGRVHVTSGVARETVAEWLERLIGQSVLWPGSAGEAAAAIHPVDWDALDSFTDRFLAEEIEPAARQGQTI